MKKRIWTVFLIAVMVFTLTGCKMNDYRSAVSMTESGNWSDAREIFSALGGDEGNKFARFDYDGYDCAAALFSFPEIKQYVFSITIPEFVGEE